MSSFVANFSTIPHTYTKTTFIPYNPLSTRSRSSTTKRKAKRERLDLKSSDEKENENRAGVKDISILSGPPPELPYISNVKSPTLLVTIESGSLPSNEGTVG
jgi:hypothetical protein